MHEYVLSLRIELHRIVSIAEQTNLHTYNIIRVYVPCRDPFRRPSSKLKYLRVTVAALLPTSVPTFGKLTNVIHYATLGWTLLCYNYYGEPL